MILPPISIKKTANAAMPQKPSTTPIVPKTFFMPLCYHKSRLLIFFAHIVFYIYAEFCPRYNGQPNYWYKKMRGRDLGGIASRCDTLPLSCDVPQGAPPTIGLAKPSDLSSHKATDASWRILQGQRLRLVGWIELVRPSSSGLTALRRLPDPVFHLFLTGNAMLRPRNRLQAL